MNNEVEKPYEGGFRGNTHYFALRVYIEDTDLGGVVYHANYLRFLERARSDLLRSAGIDQHAAIETGAGIYAVADLQIKYRKPARFDDELVVASRINELKGACCVLCQKVFRRKELLAEATVTVAFLSPEGRPRRQPRAWVETFERLRAQTDGSASDANRA